MIKNDLTYKIIGCAMKVHNKMGPGFQTLTHAIVPPFFDPPPVPLKKGEARGCFAICFTGVRGDLMPTFPHQNLNTTDFHLPYNSQLVARAKQLRQNPTPAEKKLWQEYLRTFKFRILRQRSIDRFIVDFYCAALKLAIKIDSDSHFTEEGKAYDEERTQVLEGYGLHVVRFTNHEVINCFEAVCGEIESLIPPTPLNKGGLMERDRSCHIKTPLFRSAIARSCRVR